MQNRNRGLRKFFVILSILVVSLILSGSIFNLLFNFDVSQSPWLSSKLSLAKKAPLSPIRSPVVVESVVLEIEPNIFLANFRGEPRWENQNEIELARTAFDILPENLKKLVSKEKPLQIGWVKTCDCGAYFNPRNNFIVFNREYFRNLTSFQKREEFPGTIFHEFGHAVDAHLKAGLLSFDRNRWFSHNDWANFLDSHPQIKEIVMSEYKPDPLSESFASFFAVYITMEYGLLFKSFHLPYLSLKKTREELVSWFQNNVFEEEPRRELLVKNLDESNLQDIIEGYSSRGFPTLSYSPTSYFSEPASLYQEEAMAILRWKFKVNYERLDKANTRLNFRLSRGAWRSENNPNSFEDYYTEDLEMSLSGFGDVAVSRNTYYSGRQEESLDASKMLADGEISPKERQEIIEHMERAPARVSTRNWENSAKEKGLQFSGHLDFSATLPGGYTMKKDGQEINIEMVLIFLKVFFNQYDFQEGRFQKLMTAFNAEKGISISGRNIRMDFGGSPDDPYSGTFMIFLEKSLGEILE